MITTNFNKAYNVLINDSSKDIEVISFFNYRLYFVYNMTTLREIWNGDDV